MIKKNYQILINIDKIISIYNKIYNNKDNNIIDKNNKFYNSNDIINITNINNKNNEDNMIIYIIDKNKDRIKIFGKEFVDNNKSIIK